MEDAWPPNCISDIKDFRFKGTQWTSINEVPCIPWISEDVRNIEKYRVDILIKNK